MLFGARLGLGLAETPAFPINSKATGYWFPTNERGVATAIFDSAAKLSTAIGVPFVSVILVNWGWRATFLVTGVVSFLFFVAFYAFYRNPSEHPAHPCRARVIRAGGAQAEGVPTTGSVGGNVRLSARADESVGADDRLRRLRLLVLPAADVAALLSREDVRHAVLSSGLYTAIPWLVAAVADLLVGGFLVDALIKRGIDATPCARRSSSPACCSGLSIFGATTTRDPNVAIAYITVALAGLAVRRRSAGRSGVDRPARCGRSVGSIMNFANNIMSISRRSSRVTSSPRPGSFNNVFLIAAAVLIVGILSYVFLLGRIEPIPNRRNVPGDPVVVGVDLGTSAVKVLAVTRTGVQIAAGMEFYGLTRRSRSTSNKYLVRILFDEERLRRDQAVELRARCDRAPVRRDRENLHGARSEVDADDDRVRAR